MASLTCDICDGNIVIGAGGSASCEKCGTKYSRDRLQEKAQISSHMSTHNSDSNAPLNMETTSSITNFLKLAESAKEAKNFAEAESYASKILEIDQSHWKAWYIKGFAAGYLSNDQKLRIAESVSCFNKSLAASPTDQHVDLLRTIETDLQILALAMIQTTINKYAANPKQVTTVERRITDVFESVQAFCKDQNTTIPNFGFWSYEEFAASQIATACMNAWNNQILKKYNGTTKHPNRAQFDAFIDDGSDCIHLLDFALHLKPINFNDIKKLENLIAMHQFCCDAVAWEVEYYQGEKNYFRTRVLSETAKASRQVSIAKYQQEISRLQNEKEEQEIQRKIKLEQDRIESTEQFWSMHSEVKTSLLSEHSRLTNMLDNSTNPIDRHLIEFVQKQHDALQATLNRDRNPSEPLSQDIEDLLENLIAWETRRKTLADEVSHTRLLRMTEESRINAEIVALELIIKTNRGFFGESAQKRRKAQADKNALTDRLATVESLFPLPKIE